VVERLAEDLRAEFPNMRGFSARSIWEMKRFYIAFTGPDFLRQLVAELKKSPQSRPFGLSATGCCRISNKFTNGSFGAA